MQCWIVTPGQAGFEAQGRGLAEALGATPEFKKVSIGWPWTFIPGGWWPAPLNYIREPEALSPPFPELVISCGRIAAPIAAAIRKNSGGKTRAVHIQHPQMPADRFDLVVAPRHDGLTGPNVVTTVGAVHAVTKAKLEDAARRFAPRFAHLPRPLVAVLIGGNNGRFTLGAAEMSELARRLAAMARSSGAGLIVTTSRRTGADNEALLRRELADAPAFIWDGGGDNPYLGMLGLADAVVVTEDSVSMTSEALATGKPVFVARLPGNSTRLRRFQDGLVADGFAREFTGELAQWRYTPPDDTARAAAECRRRFGWR